ncbi:glycine--tRNA ligase subunit beta [Leptolyngbya cf. ectocarpi LEGE 11479]|uniref:Glycine--tRNA ligase beta subunit n=1 Tax=Leptolyngbya cf. ectocarpi LEGE 11479 TaxID=1828722 RepID=A0A928ZY02_LEPEC|nr:glycine--tRNA ligase subunit beta [Leptolyngbya ectocarpi]MBE9069495.1 glycine--tRNA ligase subunit beta [Leptolyngbya cf. ectocarpi LEGE 11479]
MATFLLEVGTEDLPASFVSDALNQWKAKIPAELDEQLLSPESIEFYGTPRRLSLILNGIPKRQPDREEEAKGPSVKAAFKDGKPTKAAEGFARSRGVSVDDFEIRETKKGEFIFVTQKIAGRDAAEILTELIPQWILGLEGKRFMRWGDGDLRFPRPVRWLVTLMDDQVLPITLTNGSEVCVSDRTTEGHRVLHPKPLTLKDATGYVEAMKSIYIDVDPEERRKKIVAQVDKAAKSAKGEAIVNPELLDEVINLVEWPTAVVGKYDEEFLELPSEVAITEMESHQRYFPLKSGDSLLPSFITISNGDPAKSDIIAEGNGRVIRARLADGMFFFNADRTQLLADYLPKLEMVTFEERLGSVRQKVDRIVAVAGAIANQLGLSTPQTDLVNRAALLCKADLVTQMVGEFPELQGIMGEKYARHSQEPEAVATAISEHYLPKGAGDSLPETLTGQVVGLADRLDTLVSIFSLGMKPTGSSDPFALRRAANAVVSIIWAGGLDLNLMELLQAITIAFAADHYGANVAELQQDLESFFEQRVRTLLQDDEGIDYDLINAAVGEDDPDYRNRVLSNLLDARDRARFLQHIRTDGTLASVYATVNRASKLATKGDLDTVSLDPAKIVDTALFQSPAETDFHKSLQQLVPQTQAAQAERDYQKLIDGLKQAAPVVAEFFDGDNSVMVMDDDAAIRQNRLNLLGLLRNHARVLADFGAIVKG